MLSVVDLSDVYECMACVADIMAPLDPAISVHNDPDASCERCSGGKRFGVLPNVCRFPLQEHFCSEALRKARPRIILKENLL
jgi:DNA-directed RNA polymerase subunit RPC12/RpoP